MDWYSLVFEMIDMRSFSNLWYWIALAVMWSSVSHFVLGVPYDLVTRAEKSEEADADLTLIVGVNVRRIHYIVHSAGLWVLGFTFFLLTTLAITGFFYGVEFSQAVFLLAFPMSGVALLSIFTADKILAGELEGAALRKRLRRHRLYTQIIGMISIFITSVWGMYQNLMIGLPG